MDDLKSLVEEFIESYEQYRLDRAELKAHRIDYEEHRDRQGLTDFNVAMKAEKESGTRFHNACEALADQLDRVDLREALFKASRMTQYGNVLEENIMDTVEPVLPAIRALVAWRGSSNKSPRGYPGISVSDAEAKRLALPRGTYQASRWLAVVVELERQESWVPNEPEPEVARWFGLLCAAFNAAVDLVKHTRSSKPVSGFDFSGTAARVEGLWPLAKAEGELLDISGWPTDPEAALTWMVEPSMAAVAERFTAAINTALIVAGGSRTWGERPSDKLPHTDSWNDEYRDRFVEEVETRLLPKADWWRSMGMIHRDCGIAINKLNAEYQAWVKTSADKQATVSVNQATIAVRIASDYRKLAQRFEDYAKRTDNPHHIAVNLAASHVQAGRLLNEAIEARSFPKERQKINRAWWDLNTKRLPAGPFGDQAGESATDEQCAMTWVFAVGSWLAKQFPSRFRQNAAAWYWRHTASDDDGKPIDKSGKTLRGQWYHNDTPLPDVFSMNDIPVGSEGYRWELVGEPASVTDFYDDADHLEHGRVQAEIDAAACVVLAELLENVPNASGSHVIEAGKALWEAPSDEDRARYQLRGDIAKSVFARLKEEGYFERVQAESKEAKSRWRETFGEPYPESIDDWMRLAARAGISGDTLLNGEWTPSLVEPIVEGYLKAILDKAVTPKPVAIVEESNVHANPKLLLKGMITNAMQNDDASLTVRGLAEQLGIGKTTVADSQSWKIYANWKKQPDPTRRELHEKRAKLSDYSHDADR